MIGDPTQVLAYGVSTGHRDRMHSALPGAPMRPGRTPRPRMLRLRLRGAAALRLAAGRLEAPAYR